MVVRIMAGAALFLDLDEYFSGDTNPVKTMFVGSESLYSANFFNLAPMLTINLERTSHIAAFLVAKAAMSWRGKYLALVLQVFLLC